MIPPQVNGATLIARLMKISDLTYEFPMIPPQVNGAT